MNIVIEKASPTDAELILEFLKLVGSETDNLTFGSEGMPFSIEAEISYISQIENSKDDIMFIAKKDKKIVEIVAPNLWLLLLARLVSRNDEDIKCFISYINLANREIIISNKEYLQVVKILNDIIDDVEYQESVLAVMVDEEFAFLNNGDEKRTSTFIEERTKERAYAILEDRILKLEKDNAEYIKKLDSFTEENIELQTVVIQQNQKISEQLQALHSVEVLNEKQRNDSYVVYNNLVEENKKLKENVEKINRRRKNNKIVMLILIFFVINIFAIKEFLDIFIVKKNNPLTYSLFTRLVSGSVCEYESQAEQYWNWLYFFGNAIIIVIDYKIIKGIYKIIKGDNEKN